MTQQQSELWITGNNIGDNCIPNIPVRVTTINEEGLEVISQAVIDYSDIDNLINSLVAFRNKVVVEI